MNKEVDLKKRKQEGGFTLIELVVAIAIMLVIAAGVTPMLLSHLDDANTASMSETLLNVNTAFNSYYTEQKMAGATPTGNDILSSGIVTEGFMSKVPEMGNFTTIDIMRYEQSGAGATLADGDIAYALCGVPSNATAAFADIEALAEQIGSDDQDTGVLQWADATAGELDYFVFYLYGEGVDVGSENFHTDINTNNAIATNCGT